MEGGRVGEEGWREGGRKGGMEGGREGEEGWREGGKEGERERERESQPEENCHWTFIHVPLQFF